MRAFRLLILTILPSRLKIAILNRLGHSIDPSSYIGAAWLDIEKLEMGANARIAGGNLFKGLKSLRLESDARIGVRLNWFTASPLHATENNANFGSISIGTGSNITARHFFDAQHGISIGSNCLIAGYGSAFWTHGYRGFAKNRNMGIRIGDYCYIGSQVIMTPGSAIGDKSIVGTGAVVARDFSDQPNSFLAGNPAEVRKRLPDDEEFFTKNHRGFHPV